MLLISFDALIIIHKCAKSNTFFEISENFLKLYFSWYICYNEICMKRKKECIYYAING